MPHPFDLAASLESGQAHRWRKEDDWYSGVVRVASMGENSTSSQYFFALATISTAISMTSSRFLRSW